ncbi:MAG: helix-turn-helix domain-containing protein [Anaerolineaceae bacterium]|nr:helix-turn-helix domain-containing protein [Anaerolineaceae bacterium]
MDDLLTTRQLQELLQVDRITIYRMLNDGRLQGFKVGGQWRFSRQAVELWLQDQQSRVEASGATRLAAAGGSDLPLSCMQSIQNILADAVGMGALTVTPDGQLLTKPSNPNAFCSLLLGSAARQGCVDWWRTTAQGLKGRVQVLTCHAGLRCACGRVDVQGRPQAVLFAGQYVDSAVDPQGREQLARMAALQEAAHDVPPDSLLQALQAAPVPDEDCQARLLHLAPRVIAAFAEIIDERARLMGRLRRIAEITNL